MTRRRDDFGVLPAPIPFAMRTTSFAAPKTPSAVTAIVAPKPVVVAVVAKPATPPPVIAAVVAPTPTAPTETSIARMRREAAERAAAAVRNRPPPPPPPPREAVIAAAATQASPMSAPVAELPQFFSPPEEDWTPPVAPSPSPTKAMTVLPPPPPKAPPPKPESFWSKLLSLFGFGKKKTEVTISGEPTDIRSMVESVVRRSRNGDQNAMALIALVRDNARRGDAKARVSYEMLCEYVRCNPVGESFNPRIGGDSTYGDAVALSHGPKLLNPRIGAFLSRFNGEGQQAIRFGLRHGRQAELTPDPAVNSAIRMGRIVGEARALQAVREPNSSISKFDVNVGWELGE